MAQTKRPAYPTNVTKPTPYLAESRYGNPEPRVAIAIGTGRQAWRAQNAAAHLAAAVIETETAAADESWCVGIEDGTVRIELADGTAAEAARCMKMLKTLFPV